METAPLKLNSETLFDLEDKLLLFFTRVPRNAGGVLKARDDRTKMQIC
jgi:D-glycero-alpha-D-manno-heptose-7-phosphate kinase